MSRRQGARALFRFCFHSAWSWWNLRRTAFSALESAPDFDTALPSHGGSARRAKAWRRSQPGPPGFRSAPFSLRKRAGRRQGASGPACSSNPPFLRIDLQRLCLLASVQHGGMRCLRQDGQTCQAQRSHPQFPIGQDRLKRMRRGYGADEKIKDVMRQLLAVVAHSAGIQDGAGARALPIRLFMRFERCPFCGWQLHGQSPGRGPRASSAPASPALALPVSGMRPSQATGRCFRSRLPSGKRHQKQEQI